MLMPGPSNIYIFRKCLMTNGEKVKHSGLFLLAYRVHVILF